MSNQVEHAEAEQDDGFRDLISRIEARTRFQGKFYKEKCLRRRVGVRMRARGLESFEHYAQLLDRDAGEYELLLDALTINVSKFFRNWEIWNTIRESVIPSLFDLPGHTQRVWSAGCASGEEPYSVAIALREFAEATGREAELDRFEVLGTDIDRRSLDAARRAEYTDLALTDTPEEVRRRWFTPAGPIYHLHPLARERVQFEHRDLISEPAPTGLSLILCRNVIIYFDREIQEELFQRFYEALVPGGFLVLGKVETLLGRPRAFFRPVSHRDRVFRKLA